MSKVDMLVLWMSAFVLASVFVKEAFANTFPI